MRYYAVWRALESTENLTYKTMEKLSVNMTMEDNKRPDGTTLLMFTDLPRSYASPPLHAVTAIGRIMVP